MIGFQVAHSELLEPHRPNAVCLLEGVGLLRGEGLGVKGAQSRHLEHPQPPYGAESPVGRLTVKRDVYLYTYLYVHLSIYLHVYM